MTTFSDTVAIQQRLATRGIALDFNTVNTLRRAERTLHTWAEKECGDGNDYASWSIERDETTQIPYLCTYQHSGKNYRTRIADRETGALKRIAKICKSAGLDYYHQTDPRGCALYRCISVRSGQ